MQKQKHHIEQKPLNIERLWKCAGFNPNPAQRQAILHVDGPLYITAGPGSGKTRVLLWRTLNLIVFHGVKPEEIFLSTFTEKAARQLKAGLQAMLGVVTNLTGQPYDLTQMYVGTVHSLCQRILTDRRHFSIDRTRNRPPHLLDELGQYFHLYKARNWNSLVQSVGLGEDANRLINAAFEIQSESKHTAVSCCLGFFNRLSEECIDPVNAIKRLETGAGDLQEYLESQKISFRDLDILLQMYAQYKYTLTSSGNENLTDFALLQQAAEKILDTNEESGYVFKHVIIDEYQDTNTIQERLFFKLAHGHKNICVVGDDDQALYRFRGATVENFVQFPARCENYLGVRPQRISLAINYRSRRRIVDFYTQFMAYANWSKDDEGREYYRVLDKNITAHSVDTGPSVIASTAANPDDVCHEIALLVRRLIDEKKVENANQIAFLFPSMKYRGDPVPAVQRMKCALENVGLRVYAPRAGRFLEVAEALDVFGIFVQVFGQPPRENIHSSHDYDNFSHWLDYVEKQGKALMDADPLLTQYVKDRREELEIIAADYRALIDVVESNRWDLAMPYEPNTMKRALYNAPGFSERGQKLLGSAYLDRVVANRAAEGTPFSLEYIIKRITSLDWTVLDLFYRICGFEHFRQMFDLAESGADEGPVANLGLITQYLARFMDEYVSLITADLLVQGLFQRIFFMSYIFALYRLGESEYEDVEDPFPKGRIPFLTIHQAKGLEFPVVVLANPRKDDRGPNRVEQLVRPFLSRDESEPLDRMAEFDIMRMFYVALSRAQNLLVIAHYRGRGQRINRPFQAMLGDLPRIPSFDINTVPAAQTKDEDLAKTYSFTGDYLMYRKCPRQYMIFRKYGFVPSRSQTMFFGSLVHRTLEDLHHELIRRRQSK